MKVENKSDFPVTDEACKKATKKTLNLRVLSSCSAIIFLRRTIWPTLVGEPQK